jgi:hypothetical protein
VKLARADGAARSPAFGTYYSSGVKKEGWERQIVTNGDDNAIAGTDLGTQRSQMVSNQKDVPRQVGNTMPDGWIIASTFWVSVFACLCMLRGIILLGGTTRESLFDRETLAGGLLIGLALLAHGGIESLPRLSPTASYRGYVEIPGRIPTDSWILVDGRVDPPFDDDPSRTLHLVWTEPNALPESFRKRDYRYDLTYIYRSWDLRILSIHALPDPHAPDPGLKAWDWFPPPPETKWYFFVECGLGTILLAYALLKLAFPAKGNVRTLEDALRIARRVKA